MIDVIPIKNFGEDVLENFKQYNKPVVKSNIYKGLKVVGLAADNSA